MSTVLTTLTVALANRYRIEREIGHGGMATVYLAEDLKHGRKVAVKALRPDVAASLGAERFLQEIHIAAQLYHPNILALIDSGAGVPEDGGDEILYYVMPFIDGESLRAKLAREGELPVTESVRILAEVVAALAYAHEHGVVHRDIKPENVLLAGRHAFVADFGVAKAVSAAGNAEPLTQAGMIVGTATYMAPEQASGDSHVDHRADIYALGVLAYELLAGAPPFGGQTVQQILAAHLTRKPEPLSALRDSVPPELERLVMRCLAKRPADRFQTAAELLTQLEKISAAAAPHPASRAVNETRELTFRLSETVCRKLNRATLDPRMIGDVMHSLDNGVESDVLVCYLHPTSLDQWYFKPILEHSPYRGIAPTLYGFEPVAPRLARLSLADHVVLLREFLRDAIRRVQPSITLLVGFSSGGDIAFRVVGAPDADSEVPIDGLLTLSCNVSLETCFVTGILARMSRDHPAVVLAELQQLGSHAETLDDWIDVHEYLVKIFRKFHGDIDVLKRFASDLVQPFTVPGEDTLVQWFRTATERVTEVRCIFEGTGVTGRAAQALKLRNLDTGVLGEHYHEGSIVIESNVTHFDLMQTERLAGYIDELVSALRTGSRQVANRVSA